MQSLWSVNSLFRGVRCADLRVDHPPTDPANFWVQLTANYGMNTLFKTTQAPTSSPSGRSRRVKRSSLSVWAIYAGQAMLHFNRHPTIACKKKCPWRYRCPHKRAGRTMLLSKLTWTFSLVSFHSTTRLTHSHVHCQACSRCLALHRLRPRSTHLCRPEGGLEGCLRLERQGHHACRARPRQCLQCQV